MNERRLRKGGRDECINERLLLCKSIQRAVSKSLINVQVTAAALCLDSCSIKM